MNKTKIKLITISLLIITVVVGVVMGFSQALFEEKEVLETQVSMGVINLEVNGIDQATIPLDFDGMVPGEIRKVPFMVNNVGNIPGNFWVRGELLESIDPESADPNDHFSGLLHECARLSLERVRPNGSYFPIINHQPMYNIDRDFDTEENTEVDAQVNNGPVQMEIWIATYDCGSEVMGHSLKANLELYLTQNMPPSQYE